MMAKQYGSFLLRRWRLPDRRERVEVQHIQTGERMVFASLAAALEWIAAQDDQSAATRQLPSPHKPTMGTQ